MVREQKSVHSQAENDAPASRYRAPALVKGLEILELLGRQVQAMTLSGISEKLGRSRSEIFRMVQELEATGYIARADGGDGYLITDKLFLMALERPRTTTLLEAALPSMRAFAEETNQSCHLAIASNELIVVVARIESPGPVTFAVRMGHRQLISQSTSGLILFAWQHASTQERWLEMLRSEDPSFQENEFLQNSKECRAQGYVRRPSRFIRGVVDIAAPVMRNGSAVASLTAPCILRLDANEQSAMPIERLQFAAKTIAEAMTPAS